MKVLIADDDRVFRILLGRTLARWGYEVVAVEDGQQAWRELGSSTGPRLALLDWIMPGLNGPQVCEKVRNSGRPHYVYLILLTGKSESESLLTGLQAGADDYISKPVRFSELKLRLRSACRVLEAQQQQRVFAETASDGVVTLEDRRRIQFANHAAGVVFGCSPADLLGASFDDFVPGFQRRLEDTPARREFCEGICSWPPIELAGKRRTGSDLLVEVSFSEFEDHDGKKILSALIRDVTERRQLERQLAQAQRLEAIGQLAAGIAHEINTPIQYIGDNASFLDKAFGDLINLPGASAGPDPETTSELSYLREEIPAAIEQINQGVQQVARIVRAMKEFSHPGAVERVPTDINRAIESTIIVSRNEWKYVADVSTDLDRNLPPLPCIPGEFNQVILNLIVNAAHAIAEVAKDTAHKGAIHISTRMQGAQVEIRVEDTGCGIPRAIQSKVFDPFFTTKPVGKGTGQGLAIAHSVIVQKHQGSIRLESEPGIGTSFVIQLPLETVSEPISSHPLACGRLEPVSA